MKNLTKYAAYAGIGSFLIGIMVLIFPQKAIQTTGDNSPIFQGSSNTVIYKDINNPNYLNIRDSDLLYLNSKQIVQKFFELYNLNSFRKACSLFKKTKCDPNDGEQVLLFSRLDESQLNGYENIKLWQADADISSDIICAKYQYKYKADTNPKYITEITAFYIDTREDGIKEITSRVCEKKFKDGSGVRDCPIKAARKFCS